MNGCAARAACLHEVHQRREPGAERKEERHGQRRRARRSEIADREHHAEQSEPEQSDAGQVDPGGGLLLRARDECKRQDEDEDSERHVDEEDPAPRPVGDEDAAEDRADDAADRKDRREQADGAITVRPELVGDDAGRRRHDRATADRLDRTKRDEHVDVVRQPARQRGDGEQDDCADEDTAAAELVADPSGQRHHHDLAERVDRDRPAAPVDLGVQIVLQGAQRGRDDRLVDRGHEQRDRDHPEHEVAPRLPCCHGRCRRARVGHCHHHETLRCLPAGK